MKHPKYLRLTPAGDSIGVLFSIPHGKGTRTDTVAVPVADILRAADAYRGCLRNPAHLHPHESPHSANHAIWHAENPQKPIPCPEWGSGAGANHPPPDLAQLVRNYLGAIDRLAELDAREQARFEASGSLRTQHADGRYTLPDHQRDAEIHVRHRDDALVAMRKAAI